jgi:hypothetical protein
VLPALRPLLEPGGVLTGQRNQLIVRTSPANLAELRRALQALDQSNHRPVRSLLRSFRARKRRLGATTNAKREKAAADERLRLDDVRWSHMMEADP